MPKLFPDKARLGASSSAGQLQGTVAGPGESEGWWQSSLDSAVDSAQCIAEVDGLTRNIRSKKNSRFLSAKEPRLEELGQAILTMSDPAPTDMTAWVSEHFKIGPRKPHNY